MKTTGPNKVTPMGVEKQERMEDRFGDQLDLVKEVQLTLQPPAQETEWIIVSFSRTWEMKSQVC